MIPTYWKLEDIPADFGPSVATIGNFDGVHLGHQKILAATRDKAKKNAWQSVAVTFQPHPTTIVAPERALALLTQPVQRVPLFEQQGIETALILPFYPRDGATQPRGVRSASLGGHAAGEGRRGGREFFGLAAAKPGTPRCSGGSAKTSALKSKR